MKSRERFTFWLCIILSIAVTIIIRPLQDLDEVWNFNIARCIANGMVPYRDISMVSTPLLGFILAIPVSIFGSQLFVSRIVAILLAMLVFIGIFKIFRQIRLREEVSILVIFISCIILSPYLALDYNWLNVAFIIAIIWLEIKKNKFIKWDKDKTDVLIGIVGGLTICTKQSTGLFVLLAILLIPFLGVTNKRGRIQCLKQVGYRALGIVIPVSIFMLYLLITGAGHDFFDYAVNGIGTFSNKKPYHVLLDSKSLIINVLCIFVPITLVFSFFVTVRKYIKKNINTTFFTLTVYSIVAFLVVFPISDETHFAVAIVPSIVLIAYIVKAVFDRYFKGDYKNVVDFTKVVAILLTVAYTLYLEIYNFDMLGKISKYKFQNHFDNVYITVSLDEAISEVDAFIKEQEKKVYILDATAAVYMIPIDRYNKDYDMFCVGNLGSGGEEKQIEKIKNEDAVFLVICDEYNINWQNPNKVRNYVTQNMEYLGKKSIFDIYVNKQVEEVTPENTPAENQPAENAPAENAPAENTPAENAPAENAPAENAPAENTPVENAPAENTPAENTPVENAPAENTPAENAPVENAPAENVPAENTPTENPQ